MKIILLSVLFRAFLGSCGDNTLSEPAPSTPPPPTGYFPLQVGYTWKYLIWGGIGGDTIGTYNWTVVSSEKLSGRTYFKVTKTVDNYPQTLETAYYRTEDNKVYKYLNGIDSLYIDFDNADSTRGYSIQKIDSLITSAGTLRNILRVKWRHDPYPDTSTTNMDYALNIGFVDSRDEPFPADGGMDGLISAKLGDKIYKSGK